MKKDFNSRLDRINRKSARRSKRTDRKFERQSKRSDRKFERRSKRRDRKFERRSERMDRKFERRSERIDRKFERRIERSEKRIERNTARYERKLARIRRRYIRQRPNAAFTVIGVIFSIAMALVQWITFAFVDASSFVDGVGWVQSLISGFVVIPSAVLLGGILSIAFLISLIPFNIVQGIVAKISTAIFSIFMLGFINSTPEIYSTPVAFSLDYLNLIAPIVLLTVGCYFMSYNSIRAFYSSITDKSQKDSIDKFRAGLQSSKTGTSSGKIKFLSLSLMGLGSAANAKTISTIVGASILASIVQILFISSGNMSMSITCLVLFALPSIMDIVEIFSRPKESAREALFDVAKDLFTGVIKSVV